MPYAIEIKTEWQLNCLVTANKVVYNLLKKRQRKGHSTIFDTLLEDKKGEGNQYSAPRQGQKRHSICHSNTRAKEARNVCKETFGVKGSR